MREGDIVKVKDVTYIDSKYKNQEAIVTLVDIDYIKVKFIGSGEYVPFLPEEVDLVRPASSKRHYKYLIKKYGEQIEGHLSQIRLHNLRITQLSKAIKNIKEQKNDK